MYLFFNNEFYPVSTPLFTAENRAYRYGEGLFETMFYMNGRICFLKEHFHRLSNGINALGLKLPAYFTPLFIETTVAGLVKKNGHEKAARIRLSATAGSGMLNQFNPDGFDCLMESFAIKELPGQLNEPGRTLGLFTNAGKNIDALSGYKTANHLVYALAARHAVNNNLDDCLVLNTNGHVCDTSIANIFMITRHSIITPPLSSGCIAGIMREKLIEQLSNEVRTVVQQEILPKDIEEADELFITNVIQGIRWIGRYREKQYGNTITQKIAHNCLQYIYSIG